MQSYFNTDMVKDLENIRDKSLDDDNCVINNRKKSEALEKIMDAIDILTS